MKSNRVLSFFIILFLLFTLLQQLYLFQKAGELTPREVLPISGKAGTAVVNLCINNPPFFNNTCPANATQNQAYFCKLNGTDANNNSLIFSSENITSLMLFNITPNGTISFTPNNSFVGNHSMNISLNDQLSCSNSIYASVFNITVTDVNDPPYLETNIPDQEWDYGITLFAFFLDDYFNDPDGDALMYTVIGNSAINVSIDSITSQVALTAAECTEEYVIFTAIERYTNETYTANSNFVLLKANCPTEGSDGGDEGGGGAGGGGGIERTCEPDWQCTGWSECYPNGTRSRTCTDWNGCDANNYKNTFIEPCDYPEEVCKEQWDCGEWSACFNLSASGEGIQTITCTDINSCGTFLLQPNLTRNCSVQQPLPSTCNNGIKDENEIGIDCGGVCPACETDLGNNYAWITYALIVLILLIAIILMLYKYYKKEIREFFIRLGWYLTKKHPKAVLLREEAKNRLLQDIAEMEKNIPKRDVQKSAFYLAGIARYYFKEALQLPYEFKPEEFSEKLKKTKIDELLKRIFNEYHSLTYQVEFGKYKVLPYELLVLLDELRLLIFQTSNTTKADGEQQIKNRKTVSLQKIDGVFTGISNAMLAVQFSEIAFAKKTYVQLINPFESLKLSEQERAYRHITRLNDEIRYVSGFTPS
ncbi:hypothetical protein C4573_04105 [Candidatus Woesearchaeota archaeon]|nr:MAG: hypothetical protein C4573_04105 [Candidatus Woesearchaeota archaeon]